MSKFSPNYTLEYKKRQERLIQLKANPALVIGAKEYYSDSPIDFINDWLVTYDPRNAVKQLPTILPFILFPRQKEFINFLQDCLKSEEAGLVEKCRDMGATWLCSCFSIWAWIFKYGIAIGFGSRKEVLVDRLGDPDSIFEKIRMSIRYIPKVFLPNGFDEKKHSSYMKLLNPDTGATIVGESGDMIGRGGRSTIYFIDEAAHIERPEKIEASLGDNTDTPIYVSSVNGTANIFHKKRRAGVVWSKDNKTPTGKTKVFILDWREHPLKTQEWYDRRRKKAEEEGLLHVFSQEVDRDYSASVEGVVIPEKWVRASIDAHKILGLDNTGLSIAALDVADEGGDKNALTIRKGIVLDYAEAWGEGDTGETARRTVTTCKEKSVNELMYDCIGVGAGVKAETNRLIASGVIDKDTLKIVPWNATSTPLLPDEHIITDDPASPINRDFFENLKAQAWWSISSRFEKTYKAVVKGILQSSDDMISIPSHLDCREDLIMELSQPTYTQSIKTGKIVINKKPKGTSSPNLADSFIMNYYPIFTQEVIIV